MSIPWSSPMWHDKITVTFSYPRGGWVLLTLLTPAFNQHVVVYCTDVFHPFTDLFEWLNKLADSQLPADFTINEEGSHTTFTAIDSGIEKDSIELFLTQNGSKEPVLRCRANRVQVIREFLRRYEQWLVEDYDVMSFGEGHGFDLRQIDISELKYKVGQEHKN
jgi:hypothetical protein